VNAAVATLYSLGDDPIANARPGNFLDYFFFSVETIATVGYGDMHPRTLYGHIVATLATFTGISMLAVTTGLIFSRFARPRPRIMFARYPVVTWQDGARTLMIRFANERINAITDAAAKLWLVRDEHTAEGATFRKFRQLRMARDENPVFALSWTIMHVIDEDSPLQGWTAEDFAEGRAAIIVTLTGHDETSGASIHGRWNYSARDIRIDHNYVNIIGIDEEGRTRIDFTRFHDTIPLE
jgi:inward rectifier potassium channel